MTDLNIYMGYNRKAGSGAGAILIFDFNSKSARVLGWPTMKGVMKTPWPEMAVRRLNNNILYLRGDADPRKLAGNVPHVITDMRVCPTCGLWGEDGGEPDENGLCGYCHAEAEDKRRAERRDGDRRESRRRAANHG